MIIGSTLNLSNIETIALATILAFTSGYALSLIPILRNGVSLKAALGIVLAADSLSILAMEITDNAVMVFTPGAINAGLTDLLFWITMFFALIAAFVVAWPLNYFLLTRGKGHAVVHEHMHHDSHKP